MKVTMVVPVYNETQSLPGFLEQVDNAKSQDVKFLIVDNGSSDEEVSRILGKESLYWDVIRTDVNLGFGGGILFGITKSQTDIVGWMPGNLKVDPIEVTQVLKRVNINKNQIIKSSRTGRSNTDKVKTIIAGVIQSLLLGVKMFDSGGTPTVCFKDFILRLPNPPTDYVFESFVLYHARISGKEIIRPTIRYGQRKFGQSHWQRGIRSEVSLMKKIWIASRSWAND